MGRGGAVAGIQLVTDSASDLTAPLIGTAPIRIVRLEVRLGDLDPAAVSQMDGAAFWQAAASYPGLPETSAPSPGDFQTAFVEARDAGAEGVVCVTLSADLSATYQSAVTAAAAVSDSIPVEVIDSRAVTLGEGLAVLAGAERAATGASLAEVAAAVRDACGRLYTIGALDTLENLRRGGRIGAAQAFFGTLLSVKPVVVVRDGVIAGESRQRTRSRSLAYVAESAAKSGPFTRLAVVHAAARDLDAFLDLVAGFFPREEILVTHIGPVVGAHTGPGTIAICALRA